LIYAVPQLLLVEAVKTGGDVIVVADVSMPLQLSRHPLDTILIDCPPIETEDRLELLEFHEPFLSLLLPLISGCSLLSCVSVICFCILLAEVAEHMIFINFTSSTS